MKKSTLVSIVFVLFFTGIAVISVIPSPKSTTNYMGYKNLDTRKVIVVSKSIRQGGGNASRRYSGGGSSYGK